MKVYQLTDRDFSEFDMIMTKVEAENRMRHGHSCPTSPCKECDLLATYRYHFIGWRNQVMSGDTLSSRHYAAADPERDIRNEIARLQKLLPEQPKKG